MNLCEKCDYIKRSANGTSWYCDKVKKFDTYRTYCSILTGKPRRTIVIKLSEKILFKNIKYSGYMLEKEVLKYIKSTRIKTLLKHDYIKLVDQNYVLGERGLNFVQPKQSKKKKPR